MTKFLAIIFIFSLVCMSVFAKTWRLRFRNENVGSVNFPDSWKVNEGRELIEGWSPDQNAHVVVSVVPVGSLKVDKSRDRVGPDGTNIDEAFRELAGADNERDELLEQMVNYFKNDHVLVDRNSKKLQNFRAKDAQDEIQKIKTLAIDGERNGEPVMAVAGIVSLKTQRKYIEFYYWYPKARENELKPQIGGITRSITPVTSRPRDEEPPEDPYGER